MVGPFQNPDESTRHSTETDSSGIVRLIRAKAGAVGVLTIGFLSLACALILATWGFAVFTPLSGSITGNKLLLVACAVVLLGLSVLIPRRW